MTATRDIRIPRGFRFGAVEAGIKYRDRPDLAMAEAPGGAAVAALFTANRVKAAPLLVGAKHLHKSAAHMRAIIVNSGNANCATGKHGIEAASVVCSQAARLLGCKREQVLPSSTGVIGVPLPKKTLLAALPQLVQSLSADASAAEGFARAIMTTDTRPKLAVSQLTIGDREVRLLGMAKGAGMIHPNMATMLAYIFTDAAARPEDLHALLTQSCKTTFNSISVDGDTSTNDTLALFASGASGALLKGRAGRSFQAALTDVCASLAEQIVGDGEGIQHVIALEVGSARNHGEARQIANTIATSLLVKTAWAGADPNWGRILAAIGRSGIDLDPGRVDIWFGGQQVCRRGVAHAFDEQKAHRYMLQPAYGIRVSLGRGKVGVRVLTNDLTADYVAINADYRT